MSVSPDQLLWSRLALREDGTLGKVSDPPENMLTLGSLALLPS